MAETEGFFSKLRNKSQEIITLGFGAAMANHFLDSMSTNVISSTEQALGNPSFLPIEGGIVASLAYLAVSGLWSDSKKAAGEGKRWHFGVKLSGLFAGGFGGYEIFKLFREGPLSWDPSHLSIGVKSEANGGFSFDPHMLDSGIRLLTSDAGITAAAVASGIGLAYGGLALAFSRYESAKARKKAAEGGHGKPPHH